MGTDDKIENKTEELGGKAKEAVGEASGDRDLQAPKAKPTRPRAT
jgi:uncharacterized protein YjbJ (UPF0337 family)